jgi:hypothetical protein
LRGTFGVDTGRAAGQDDRQRVAGLDLLDGGGMRDHLGEHPSLPNTTGDQLRILRTEVDHQHRPVSRSGVVEVSRFGHGHRV